MRFIMELEGWRRSTTNSRGAAGAADVDAITRSTEPGLQRDERRLGADA